MKIAYTPENALVMLQAHHLIGWAANPVENPAWSHANAATKDAKDQIVADRMDSSADGPAWAHELARYVRMAPAALAEVLEGEPTKRSEIQRTGKSPRPIGVPTFVRRLLSTHLGNVLTLTSEAVLPPSIIAYRRGHEDAVIGVLRKVAAGVMTAGLGKPLTDMETTESRPGVVPIRYWAKLDFASYFSSIPRWAIRAALLRYGYPEPVVQIVMAMVKAPVVKLAHGRAHDITPRIGTEQGMAESAVLANLVPFELDAWFGVRCKRLVYVRYSDDIFIGGQTREEVVGAVRFVIAWAKKLGLRLKDVSPGQRAGTLVHDVTQQRIELLGAEIDQNGKIQMPIKKLKDALSKLTAIHASYREGEVGGVSVMAGGKRVRAYDATDFFQVHDGFIRHWQTLNPIKAEKADALIKKTFALARLPRSGELSTTWSARLWGDQETTGGEPLPDGPSPGASTTTTTPEPRAPLGPQAKGKVGADDEEGDALPALWASMADASSENGVEESLGPETVDEDEVEASPTGRSDEFYTESEEMAVDSEGPSLSAEGQEEGLVVGCSAGAHAEGRTAPELDREDVKDASVSRTEGRKSYRSDSPSNPEEEMLRELSRIFESLGGPVAEPPEGRTPPPVVSGDDVFIEARRERRSSIVTVHQAALDEDGEVVWGQRLYSVPGRPEVAVVRTMLGLVGKRTGGKIRFLLDNAFLPKALVQQGRAIRSPILYARLRELHQLALEHRVSVEVVGPKRRPSNGQSPVYFSV